MSWETDVHGIVFKARQFKLYRASHTWAMKLTMALSRTERSVRVMTYSLPAIAYATKQLARRPYNLQLICHSKFIDRAHAIKRELPTIRLAVHDKMHSKVVLVEDETIFIGSENFGSSGWHETFMGVRSKEAYKWFVENSFDVAWQEAREI